MQPSDRLFEDQMAKYTSLSELPKNALDSYNNTSAACLRNVKRMFQVIKVTSTWENFQTLATLLVTKASPERSFSQLRALKKRIQSSMKEGYGLASTRVHSNKEVPSDKIIDSFAKMKAQRLKVAL